MFFVVVVVVIVVVRGFLFLLLLHFFPSMKLNEITTAVLLICTVDPHLINQCMSFSFSAFIEISQQETFSLTQNAWQKSETSAWHVTSLTIVFTEKPPV